MATIKAQRRSHYVPGNPPTGSGPLGDFMRQELERIADAFESPVSRTDLDILYAPPARLPLKRVPVVYADGTRWNPGSGAGVYAYYASAWHFLG